MELKHLVENTLFVAVAVLAFLPLMYLLLFRFTKTVRIVVLASLALAMLVLVHRPTQDLVLDKAVPTPIVHDGMMPSESCVGCHPGQYESWHNSFHRTMTQVAGLDSVVAPFDGRTLLFEGSAFEVNRRDNEFWVTEVKSGDFRGAAQESPSKRVVMTTGSRHQQIYWTQGPNGSLRQFPWVYEIAMARWIPSEHTFVRPDDWKQYTPTWNKDCIRCHSVGPLPNFDSEQDDWQTEVTELGIACASCHGPAEEHIQAHQNPIHRHMERVLDRPDPTIVNPRRLSQERSAEVCGQCHAYSLLPDGFYAGNWSSFRAGKQLHEHFQVSDLTNTSGAEHMFWPDGSARTGGREYNSMTLSGCFTQGEMTCISCHALHGDEPLDLIASSMNGDKACFQCHTEYEEDIASHTFHEPDSSGSRCLNCHMPYTSYALLAAVRSHRIGSPGNTGITTSDRPNACNLCHLDKTLAWTAEYLTEQYGLPAIDLDDEQKEISAGVLWALRGDAGQRTITAWHMGQAWALEASGDHWQVPYLSRLLLDPYSAIRLIAHRSLTQLTGEDIAFDYIGTEEERTAVMEAYLNNWVLKPALDQDLTPEATLVVGAGQLQNDTFERLYQQRDNRRLLISE